MLVWMCERYLSETFTQDLNVPVQTAGQRWLTSGGGRRWVPVEKVAATAGFSCGARRDSPGRRAAFPSRRAPVRDSLGAAGWRPAA